MTRMRVLMTAIRGRVAPRARLPLWLGAACVVMVGLASLDAETPATARGAAGTASHDAQAARVAAGRALYEGKAGCASCHANERLGPDLSWIGILRGDESLIRSLLDPDAEVHPAFYTIVAEPKSGPVVRGLKIREDERQIVVRDTTGEYTLDKGSLTSLRREKRSLMPSYTNTLTPSERADVVAFLRTQKTMWPVAARERTREIPLISENVPFFDRTDRAEVERTDAMIAALELPKGARVADLGAGTGFYTWRLAEAVGPSGRVSAVDVQPKMLEIAAQSARQHGLSNVEFVQATERDPRLAPRAYDMVFIANAYHEFSEPEVVMREVRQALKPGGRLFVLEYKAENPKAPASGLHRMSFIDLRTEIEPIGFALDKILDFLPTQHGLVFAPAE